MTSISAFNHMSPEEAAALLRPCLDVDRWVDTLLGRRPYSTADELYAAARTAAGSFTGPELEAALAHHPRIGQRAAGSSTEANLSRSEQSTLNLDEDVQRRLTSGNLAYEQRFGRVFLIRAAGRSSEQILAQLESRLTNDVDTEDRIVGAQLQEIALLRLAAAVPG